MASQEPKSDIVDLLYDDELDEDSREALQDELASSEEARRELADFNEVLGAVRQADLQEEPSEAVHESIMAAAREHAAKSTSRKAQVTKRAPAPAREEKGLWSRLNSSGVGQLVLAASVVLVAGVVFVQLAGDKAPGEKFQTANEAVDSQVHFDPPPQEIAQNEAPVEEEAAEGEPAEYRAGAEQEETGLDDALGKSQDEALAGAETKDKAPKRAVKTKSKGAEKSTLGEFAKLDQPRPADDRARTKSRSSSQPRKARPRKKASKKEDTMELWGNEGPTNSQSRSDGVALDMEQQREAANQRPKEEAAERDDSAISDVADLGSLGGDSLEDEPPSSAGRASSSASGATAPAPEADSDSDEPSQSSVNNIESRYQSGNYAGVVTQADRYLSRSSGDKPDEARVLELKARALARQGKNSEADSAYAQLQKQFPSYKADQVERERKALANEKQKQRRRRSSESKQQADDVEMAPEMDDVDQAAPSSLEAY